MTGAMRELFAETCACNYVARHIIDFGAADRFTSANILAHEIDRRIAGFAHDIENARVLFRDRFANITSLGLVSRDCFGFVQFRSRIDQHEIAAFDW